MKLLGQVLLVCLLLSILKALVVLIAIAIVLLLIWGLFCRTHATVGLVAFSLLIEALQVHPAVTIGLIVLSLLVVWTAPHCHVDDDRRSANANPVPNVRRR